MSSTSTRTYSPSNSELRFSVLSPPTNLNLSNVNNSSAGRKSISFPVSPTSNTTSSSTTPLSSSLLLKSRSKNIMSGEMNYLVDPQDSKLTMSYRKQAQVTQEKEKVKVKRRLWSSQDQSTLNVQLLKTNLAEEGCQEAQLNLAKNLLKETQNLTSGEITLEDAEKCTENNKLATYWLIKASEQGSEEATGLLKDLYQKGQGITDQNILDVQNCINTPTNEKLTFRASRKLFQKLCNGEEFVTSGQLLNRIRRSSLSLSSEKSNGQSPRNSTAEEGENILTDDDQDSSEIKGNGHVNTGEGLNANVNSKSNSKEIIQKYQQPQCTGEKLTLDDLLETAASYNNGQVPKMAVDSNMVQLKSHRWELLSTTNVILSQFIVLAFIVGAIEIKLFSLFLSSILITWTSYNFAIFKKRIIIFKDWTDCFKSVLQREPWTPAPAESRLSRKNLLLPLLLSFLSFTAVAKIPGGYNSLKLIMGLISCSTLYFGVILSKRWFPSIQFMLFFTFKSLPLILQYIEPIVQTEFLSPYLLEDLRLNFTSSLQYILPAESIENLKIEALQSSCKNLNGILILKLVVLSSGFFKSRKRICEETLPEILFILWSLRSLKMCENFTIDELQIVIGSAVCAILILLTCTTPRNRKKSRILGFSTLLILIFAAGIAIKITVMNNFFEVGVGNNLSQDDTVKFVEWSEYKENCHNEAWRKTPLAQTQLDCYKRYGYDNDNFHVRWKMILKQVEIKKIENENIYSKSITFEVTGKILSNDISSDATNSAGNDNKWSLFSTTTSPDSNELEPKARVFITTRENEVIQHLLNLRTNDKIEFQGKLNSQSAGGLVPEVNEISYLKCIYCSVADYGDFNIPHSEELIDKVVKFYFKIISK